MNKSRKTTLQEKVDYLVHLKLFSIWFPGEVKITICKSVTPKTAGSVSGRLFCLVKPSLVLFPVSGKQTSSQKKNPHTDIIRFLVKARIFQMNAHYLPKNPTLKKDL
jgi:hypothetical protein